MRLLFYLVRLVSRATVREDTERVEERLIIASNTRSHAHSLRVLLPLLLPLLLRV